MADKKVIFVAFAIEDERQRDFLKGQSLLTNSPFEYIDMSVKEAYIRYSPAPPRSVHCRIKLLDS